MILVLTTNKDETSAYQVSLKNLLPEQPFVFTADEQQVRNWLPHVDAVFLHQNSTWLSSWEAHHQVLMVIPETPAQCNPNAFLKTMRVAGVVDTYCLIDKEDQEHLKARFAGSTIHELETP